MQAGFKLRFENLIATRLERLFGVNTAEAVRVFGSKVWGHVF